MEDQEMEKKLIAFFTSKKIMTSVIIIPIIVVLLIQSLFTVDEGHVGIVKTFGKAQNQVDPGLHFKKPFIDHVEILEVRTRKNSEKLKAATHEQMPVSATVSVNWTVIRSEAFDLYKKYGGLTQFEKRILDPKLRSSTKDAISKFKAEEIIQNRGLVVAKIEEALHVVMKEYPVKLDSVQLEQLILPAKYIESIEVKQREKNLADAEKHKLTRQNLEAQREVNTANAKRDAEKARADGKAYAIEKEATAEAKAIKLKGLAEAKAILKKAEALKQSATLVDYVRAQQWDGKLPQTMMGGDQSILWSIGK